MQILKPLARFLAGLGATPFALALALPSVAHADGQVNIYSYREPQLIDPLLKAFTDKTGIKANIVYASAGLNERLTPWGAASTTLASGETGTITLPNGFVVTVTPTVRPETPQEVIEGQAARPMVRVERTFEGA